MSNTIKTVTNLKNLWVDGYTPNGSDFSDVFTTMVANTSGSGDVVITSATGNIKVNNNTVILDSMTSSLSVASASYITPGATLYIVSGSNDTNSSYIEPYNLPTGIPYTPPFKEGRMFYSSDYNNWVYYNDQDFGVHIGKEVIWKVYNNTGTTLTMGSPVYLSGSTDGNIPDVYPCIADGSFTKIDTVGVIRADIPVGEVGYVIQAGVIHNIDMAGFNTGDSLYISSILGALTNVPPVYPFEQIRVGNCQTSGINGSLVICPAFFIPPIIPYAGMTTGPTITFDGTGSIIVSSGSVNLYLNSDGAGDVYSFPVHATTMSLITGSTNYIVVKHEPSDGGVYQLTTDSSYANGVSIVRVAHIDINTEENPWELHIFNVGIVGFALANKINNKDISLYGFQRQYGLVLYTTGSPTNFGITDGKIWYGSNPTIISEYNTTVPNNECYHYINSASVWTYVNTPGYDNLNYNDSSGLVPLSDSKWTVNYIYRLVAGSTDASIILDTNQYDSEILASTNSTIPELPQTFNDIGMLVGRIIVQSGSTVPTIESAFGVTFNSSVATNHENLLGLQGGTAGQHNHLTLEEYTGTGTGVFVRQTNSTITGSITTASYSVNSVTASYSLVSTSSSYGLTASYIDAGNITTGTINNSRLPSQINITGITGSLNGTSSWSTNSLTASSINFTPTTSSYSNNSTSSSYSISSSNSILALTASSINFTPNLSNTASYILGSNVSGKVSTSTTSDTASYNISSSHSLNSDNSISASYSLSSSYSTNSTTSSYIDAGNITTGTLNNSRLPTQISITGITGSLNGTSSWSTNSLTASSINFTPTTSNTASYVLARDISGTITNASTASYLNSGTYTITSSWSNNSVSASYAPDAPTASYANNALSSSYALSASYSLSSSYAKSASYLFGTVGASTTTNAALTILSGSLLTTASVGVVEYDGVNFYGTTDTTGGRGAIPTTQYFVLTQTGSAITTIANFFGANSNISLASNGLYEIEIIMFFTKAGPAGTGTYTFTYNAAPTNLSFDLISTVPAGVIAPTSIANNSSLFSQVYNNTSSPYSYTDGGNLGTATHYRKFKILLVAASTTNYMKIQATSSAGTITPGIGSRWCCKRLSSTNVGNFSA